MINDAVRLVAVYLWILAGALLGVAALALLEKLHGTVKART